MVLEKHMEEIVDVFQNQCDEQKVVMVLEEACRDGKAGKTVEEMWAKKFR